MPLLFRHPLWWVTEAAASSLASLSENSEDYQTFVRRLLPANEGPDNCQGDVRMPPASSESHWRTQYGAIETAFALRNFNQDLFNEAVRTSYDHRVSRIRALCAEDLISQIIERGVSDTINTMWKEYEKLLVRWFGDDDCWVLDHPYRLLGEMCGSGSSGSTRKAIARCIDIAQERENAVLCSSDWKGLLTRDWTDIAPRSEFLQLIEERKKARTAA